MRPSPPYLGLILAATGKLEAFLAKGCQMREDHKDNEDYSSDDDDKALTDLVKTTFMQGLSSAKQISEPSSSPRSGDASPN